MFKRLISTGFKSCLASVPRRNFVLIPAQYAKESEYIDKPLLNLYAKRLRKIVLDRTILEKSKQIVPAVRLRQEDDTLEKLRNSKLCSAVINARDEFEDLDFVLQSSQIFAIKRQKSYEVQSYYIKIGDEMVRCTVDEIKIHPIHGWVVQAKFNRYIPGRANLLNLPLKMIHNKENKYLNKGSDFAVKFTHLWVNCYNDEYPAALDFNPSSATPTVGYRLGEFANSLPDGIELHPRYSNQLHNYIIELGLTRDLELERQLEYLDFQRRMKAGDMLVDENELEEEDEEEKEQRIAREARKAAVREKAKKKTPRSLKKLVAQMNFKVKEGVVGAVAGKDSGKGGKEHKEG